MDDDARGRPATGEQRKGVLSGAAAYAMWGLFPLFFHRLRPASALEVLGHRIVWSFLVVSVASRFWTPYPPHGLAMTLQSRRPLGGAL